MKTIYKFSIFIIAIMLFGCDGLSKNEALNIIKECESRNNSLLYSFEIAKNDSDNFQSFIVQLSGYYINKNDTKTLINAFIDWLCLRKFITIQNKRIVSDCRIDFAGIITNDGYKFLDHYKFKNSESNSIDTVDKYSIPFTYINEFVIVSVRMIDNISAEVLYYRKHDWLNSEYVIDINNKIGGIDICDKKLHKIIAFNPYY